MTDGMKAGLATGGVVAALGLLASYLCYKEGHLDGFSEGQAKGADLFKKKFDTLKQKCEEQTRQIQELKRLKQQVQNDQVAMRATARELCNQLRGLVSDEVYQRMLANINRKGVIGCLDEAVEELEEGKKAVGGGSAKGRIVGTRCFNGKAWRSTPPHYNDSPRLPGESETRIVFSSTVRGWYFWPKFEISLLPDDKVLSLYPRLIKRVQELIPGWDFEERTSFAKERTNDFFRWNSIECVGGRARENVEEENKRDYDVMAICSNALCEAEGGAFLCDKVEFHESNRIRCMRHEDENEIVDLDYDNGTVKCSALDEFLRQKCDEVAAAINAFWSMLSDSERGEMEDCRKILELIGRNSPVTGTLCMDGDVPVIRFCSEVGASLKVTDAFLYGSKICGTQTDVQLYFEGDGLYVSKNEDLHDLLLEIIPHWRDVPISDSRINNIIDGRRNFFQYCRHQKPQLPARGAVREYLRFEEAGKQLMNTIFRQFEGREVVCQRVTLKRCNGDIAKESSAESDEISQILKREFEVAQHKLNEFAESRNAIMYSCEDLIPSFADSYYYKKWARFERMSMLPQCHVGDMVNGVVRNIKDYGVFVDFNNTSGLLHISEISDSFIDDIRKVLSVGQHITAKIISMENGKIGLSMRKKKRKGNDVRLGGLT